MLNGGIDMTYVIRRLKEGDLRGFRELRLRALTEVPAAFQEIPEQFAARSDQQILEWVKGNPEEGSFILGIFSCAGDLTGLAGLGVSRKEKPRIGHVWGVYVAPEARGTGAGRKIMEELLAIARSEGHFDSIDLEVVKENKRALGLYKSLGFEITGILEGGLKRHGQSWDEYTMRLRLQRGTGG